jgi:Homocysteine S-methyltransferase
MNPVLPINLARRYLRPVSQAPVGYSATIALAALQPRQATGLNESARLILLLQGGADAGGLRELCAAKRGAAGRLRRPPGHAAWCQGRAAELLRPAGGQPCRAASQPCVKWCWLLQTVCRRTGFLQGFTLTPFPLILRNDGLHDTAARFCNAPGCDLLDVRALGQAISAALPVLREALPATVRVGAYANGFRRTTSEWLHEQRADSTAEPPQLDRDPGAGCSSLFGCIKPLTDGKRLACNRPKLGREKGPMPATLLSISSTQQTSDVVSLHHVGDYQEGVITPEAYARFAAEWVAMGASIVGGCCGVGPEHIRVLKRQLCRQP